MNTTGRTMSRRKIYWMRAAGQCACSFFAGIGELLPRGELVTTEMSWLSVALRRLTMWMLSVVSEFLLSSCVLNSMVTPVKNESVSGAFAGRDGPEPQCRSRNSFGCSG